MNNLPTKPRKIGTRTSVLDRLHLKQAALNAKNLPQSVMENRESGKGNKKKGNLNLCIQAPLVLFIVLLIWRHILGALLLEFSELP